MEQNSIIGEQMRKARWYAYMCRRFNLVSFEDIADWCARETEGVGRSEAKQEQALRDLENSVSLGEFGPPDRPLIPCFPKPPPVSLGEDRWAIKLSAGQILWMRDSGHSVTKYLHIPADQARRWLDARGIPAPPWLMSRCPAASSDAPLARADGGLPTAKRPFDRDDAKRLLLGRKVSNGPWAQRPARNDVSAFLRQNYANVPRDPVDQLMTEIWGAGKRGPKPRKTR